MFRVHQISSPLVSCRNNSFIREEVLAQWRELSPFSALILVRFSCTFSLFFVSLSFRGFSPRFSDFPSYLKSTVPLSNAIEKFSTKNSPSDLSLLITYSFFIYSFNVYDFTFTKVVTAAVSFDH